MFPVLQYIEFCGWLLWIEIGVGLALYLLAVGVALLSRPKR